MWLQAMLALFFSAQLIHQCNFVQAYTVGTTTRKRLGSNSFIRKQERGKLRDVSSSNELKELASTFISRKRGSNNYYKAWKQWSCLALDSIRYDLSKNLPYPADRAKFENLFFRLGIAADVGQMPSFSDPGARSGYALEFFSRARNLADLYFDALNPSFIFPKDWVNSMMETPMHAGNEPYHIVSLGGGPGFDFVSAALVSSFSATTLEKEPAVIKATIFDYEEGWSDLVEAMGASTRNILQQQESTCKWGGKCDITRPLNHPRNQACLELVGSTQLWTCQYCFAENSNLLRESNCIFFRDLFENAKDGALFVFTETNPRIWPDLCHLMEEHCPYMQIGFNKKGREMLLRKSVCSNRTKPLMSEKDRKMVEKFDYLSKHHQQKIDAGWHRQKQKTRC
mmetsp:Transcript_26190/g.39655  ORF Transcript_26190/g.39655 Transcript_26190/m.39655 type:complete len:397 (+) Transcript_26190:52-1242(+)|eukprot:CAMPEP_0178901762 /NCGR_PEP_ID=MMETSP0786-20121207/4221_1 /TAXON_ID=186022 /ORGANISM="Thalassionema frauenfeldii, Strain CCMP 1798" /LENGTH=396 /DNA_ID=CAMNT_0020572937 /DNA_START=40 /DNA_END=1233 /DNA_ORIENTATION=-